MRHLLFHPKVTFTAGLLAIGSFLTLIAGLSYPLHKIAFVGRYADQIVAYAMVLGPVFVWVATYGRSPASAVDNYVPTSYYEPPMTGGGPPMADP